MPPPSNGLYETPCRAWSLAEIIAGLRERGFELRGVYHMAYDAQGQAVQADFLFARRGLDVDSSKRWLA